MDDKFRLIVSQLGEERVKTNVDLTEHLQTGLGGVAESFYIATNTAELLRAIELCRELNLNFFIIGTGSKVALSDIKGLVIKNRSDNLKIFGIKGKVSPSGIGVEEALVEADSGVSLKRLAEFTKNQKLTGFETLEDVLGTVGGSLTILPILQGKIEQIRALIKSGEVAKKDLTQLSKEDIILSVIFKLRSD